MSLDLQDDHMCYVCGKDNPAGFRLKFQHPQSGVLTADTVFSKEHQGYRDIVHGGMITMLLDEMMVNLAWLEGKPAVTAELNVRLKKPTRVGERVFFEGRIDSEESRLLRASATARNAKGQILASAAAVCVRIKKGHNKQLEPDKHRE